MVARALSDSVATESSASSIVVVVIIVIFVLIFIGTSVRLNCLADLTIATRATLIYVSISWWNIRVYVTLVTSSDSLHNHTSGRNLMIVIILCITKFMWATFIVILAWSQWPCSLLRILLILLLVLRLSNHVSISFESIHADRGWSRYRHCLHVLLFHLPSLPFGCGTDVDGLLGTVNAILDFTIFAHRIFVAKHAAASGAAAQKAGKGHCKGGS